jgi:putative FmdB family regulatory protein
MPVYPFWCSHCEHYREDVRHMSEAGDPAICDRCGRDMERKWTVPQVSVPNDSGYFNHGLGTYIKHKSDVKDAITKINEATGQDLVEVGNEKVKPKPIKHDYEIPRGALDGLKISE